MASNKPRTLVVGAPRQTHRYGIFSALDFRPADSAQNWQFNGVKWEQPECGYTSRVVGPLDDAGEREGLPKDLSQGSFPSGEADTFTVYATAAATPIAWDPQALQARAEEALTFGEQFTVEEQLWALLEGEAPTSVGSFPLNDSIYAIAALEKSIGDALGTGVLHIARDTAAVLLTKGAIRRNGQRLETELGNPVIAGAGYDSDTIFATPALFGYRSEVFYSSGRPYDLLKTADNDLHAIAERTYVVGYDDCSVLSATITART